MSKVTNKSVKRREKHVQRGKEVVRSSEVHNFSESLFPLVRVSRKSVRRKRILRRFRKQAKE